MKKRSEFWDIVKAIGIISIVIGHCYPPAVKFVYTYHLAIFFFVSGYLFNASKYVKTPYDYIGNKLRSTWPKYFWYSVFFILINNILIAIGIYPKVAEIYSLKNIFTQIVLSTVFFGGQTIGGALWFIPILVYTMIIFCFMANVADKFKSSKLKMIALGIICSFIGLIGIKLAHADYHVVYHLQTTFLIMPIIYVGYLLNHITAENLMRHLKWYIAIPCVIFILTVLKYTGGQIELSISSIISPIWFYPVSFAGIYFVLYLSKLIINADKIKSTFSMIGRYSFDIMALHFLMFKIVDLFSVLLGYGNIDILSRFPYSNEMLMPLYMLVGIFGSIGICKIVEIVKKSIYSKLQKIELLDMEE